MTTRIYTIDRIIALAVLLPFFHSAYAAPLPGGGGAGEDLCANVTPVALGDGDMVTLSGNNTSATGTNDFHPDSDFFPFGAQVMWHAFTITECMNISFNYCSQDPAWSETWGFLFDACPGLAYLGPNFNDIECGNGNYTYYHSGLSAGTYYIAVPQLAGSVGAYTIELTGNVCGASMANDMCENVVPVELASGVTLDLSGDNSGATATDDWVTGSVFTGSPVVWHAITTTTCNHITVDYCGLTPTWTNALGMLATSCPVDEASNIPLSAFNNTDCPEGNMTYIFYDVPPGTYYIPVLLDPGASASGPYTIHVTAEYCGGLLNDQCQNVIPQTLNAPQPLTFTGDNSTANDVNDWAAGSPFAGAPVAWHTFETTGCEEVHISYCGTTPVWNMFWGFIASNCPGEEMTVHTLQDTCADGNAIFIYNDLAAGTYYIPVLNHPDGNGPYEITVTGIECAPSSVEENAASTLSIFPNPSQGELTIVNGSGSEIRYVEVIDMAGRMIHMENLRIAPSASQRMDISMLAPGLYVVRGSDAANNRTDHKLIVE